MTAKKKEAADAADALRDSVTLMRLFLPPCPLCSGDAGVFTYKQMVKIKCDLCHLTLSWPLMVVQGKPMYGLALDVVRRRWCRRSNWQPDPEIEEVGMTA